MTCFCTVSLKIQTSKHKENRSYLWAWEWYLWRDLGTFVDIEMNIITTTDSKGLFLLWSGYWWDNGMRGCKILCLGTQTATKLSKLVLVKKPYRPHTYDDWLCQFWREKMYKIQQMKDESWHLNLHMRPTRLVRSVNCARGLSQRNITMLWEAFWHWKLETKITRWGLGFFFLKYIL